MGLRWRSALGVTLVACQLQAQTAEPLNDLLARVAYLPPEQAWLLLQQFGSDYINDADYNYALGVYASNSGNYAQAINAFERTVLLRPAHAGAWLDLALAYKQAGDVQTALDLLNHIQTLNPPRYLQPLLDSFKRDWQPVQQAITLSYTMGHSSNPSAAATDAMIPLYIGSWTSLPLSATMRPKASVYHQLGFDWVRTSQQQLWLVQASQRHYPSNERANQQQLAGLWQYTRANGARWQSSAAYSDLNFIGYQAQLALMHLWPVANHWYVGAGYRWRRFQEPAFDNNALTAQLLYQPKHSAWQWSLANEQESPTGNRPGGSAQRWVTQLMFDYPLPPSDKLSVFAQASYQQDQQAYASLLPVSRQLSWYQLGAYWYHPINNQFTLKSGVQWGQQDANHPLFAWQDTQWSVSLLWRP